MFTEDQYQTIFVLISLPALVTIFELIILKIILKNSYAIGKIFITHFAYISFIAGLYEYLQNNSFSNNDLLSFTLIVLLSVSTKLMLQPWYIKPSVMKYQQYLIAFICNAPVALMLLYAFSVTYAKLFFTSIPE